MQSAPDRAAFCKSVDLKMERRMIEVIPRRAPDVGKRVAAIILNITSTFDSAGYDTTVTA